jgi:hypothetical protein
MKQLLLAVAGLLLLASAAQAQTPIVNPHFLDFDCPTQTGLNDPDSYLVDFYASGATNPLQTSAPIAVSALTVITTTSPSTCRIALSSLPYPVGQPLTAKVRAANSAGASAPSNAVGPFGKQGSPSVPANLRITP